MRPATLAAFVAASALLSVAAFPSPVHAAPATKLASCAAPDSVMLAWIAAWKAKDFRRMVALSQVSWRLRTGGAVGLLRAQYGFKDVLSYRLVRCSSNGFLARVTFRVKYRTFKVSDVLITGNVIRENGSGNPSSLGHWGVNPLSTLREDPVG